MEWGIQGSSSNGRARVALPALSLALLMVLLLLLVSQPAQAASPPTWLEDVKVNPDAETDCSMPMIAAGPDGTLWLVLTRFIPGPGPREIALFNSSDGGRTWSKHSSDYTYIDHPVRMAVSPTGIVVLVYRDGPEISVATHGNVTVPKAVRLDTGAEADFPDVTIDTTGKGHCVFIIDDGRGGTDIMHSWAAPPYDDWSTPVSIMGSDPSDDRLLFGPRLATNYYGELHLVFQAVESGQGNIYWANSTDGGATWSPDGGKIIGYDAKNEHSPDVAVNDYGYILAVWTLDFSASPADTDIIYAFSMDGGTSFTTSNAYSSTMKEEMPSLAKQVSIDGFFHLAFNLNGAIYHSTYDWSIGWWAQGYVNGSAASPEGSPTVAFYTLMKPIGSSGTMYTEVPVVAWTDGRNTYPDIYATTEYRIWIEGSVSYAWPANTETHVQFNSQVLFGQPPFEFNWTFGDGENSYEQNATHTYRTPGYYQAELRVTDAYGWTDFYLSPTITILEHLEAEIAASPVPTDVGIQVAFDSTISNGTHGPLSYYWEFGDGGTTNDQSPAHSYDAPGAYQVNLTVVDFMGAIAHDQMTIQVNLVPSLEVSASPLEIDVHQQVEFHCTVHNGTPPFAFWWDFGDAGTSSLEDPAHIYDIPGIFSPSLSMTDSAGAVVVWHEQNVTVNPSPSFTVTAEPERGISPLDVHFTCSPADGTPPYSFEWDFGDGGTSTEQNPIHQYLLPGVYMGTLLMMDSVGTTNTQYTPTIEVYPPLTIVASADRDQIDIEHPVSFNCTVTGGAPPYHFLWDFGDGGMSELPNVTHAYSVEGNYLARMTVNDSLDPNTTANQTISIKVNALPEVVGELERTELNVFQPLAFNCTVYNGTPPFQYLWDFGDGDASGQPATEHGYQIPGVYNATLVITDALGEEATWTSPPIKVNALPVAIVLTYITSDLAPATVWFECVVQGGTSPYNYTWDFGDSGQGFGNFTNHTYLVSGDYLATVLIMDAAGSQASAGASVLIFAMISVQATVSPTVVIVNEEAWFNCTVSGGLPPYSYHWDFGDGNTSEERNATHAYSAPGFYQVILNYSDSNDPPYYSSWTGSVQVIPPPVPPSAPLDLTAMPGDGFVKLSWSAPTHDGGSPILGYNIYRGSGPPLAYLTNVSASTLSYNDTQVLNGLTYHYHVTAVNSAGLGEPSDTVSATPLSPPVPPGVPTGLHVVEGEGQLTLNWTAPSHSGSSSITGYRLYRGTTSGSLELLTNITSTTYIDHNVTTGQSYFYQVSAVNAAGEGALSAQVEGEAQEGNPPPAIPMDYWALMIVILVTALAIVLIAAMIVRNAKKKAARMRQGYTNCPRCGAEVPPTASNCPQCSAHIRGPR